MHICSHFRACLAQYKTLFDKHQQTQQRLQEACAESDELREKLMRMYERTIDQSYQPARKRHKFSRSRLTHKRHDNIIQIDSEDDDIVTLSPPSPKQSPPPSPSRSGCRIRAQSRASKRSNVDSFRRTSSARSLVSMVRRSLKDKTSSSKLQARAGPRVVASSGKPSSLESMNAARKASILRVNHNPVSLGKSRARKRSAGSQSGA